MSETINPDFVTDYELETWGRCAESYLDTFAALTRETIPLLIDAAGVGAGKQVLDIGSGPGHVAAALSLTGAQVTGVDFAEQMVEVAQNRYPEIAFQQANAEQLPFENDSFDAVVSNFVVHHLARPDVVFREVCRVLKPGGCFAFIVFEAPEAQSSIGAFFQAVEAHHDLDDLPHGPLFGMTDRSVYEGMLTAGGLAACRLDSHEIVWESETMDPVLHAFMEWGNIAALPADVQGKIEASARENMQAFQQQSGYSFPHTALMGVATKPQ